MFRLPIVKFFSRILNRITITVVLVALQVAWLLWVFFSITTGRVWVNAGLQLLSLLMMLYLVRKDENSAYKIGWIVLMGVLPLLGGALYLSFGNKRPAKRLRNKLKGSLRRTKIRNIECYIRSDDSDNTHIIEVKSLCNQLGSDEYIRFLLRKIRQYPIHFAAFLYGIKVKTRRHGIRKIF